MNKKKEIPLVILKELAAFVDLKGNKFDIVEPGNELLNVIDKDSESNFHFSILEYKKASSGAFLFHMKRSPKNYEEPGIYQTWVDISKLQTQFKAWVSLLDEYENTKSFFDDPILETFSNEFFGEFEILDEDSEKKPLSTKQILLLDKYLDSVDNKLEKLADKENKSQLDEIKEDIFVLKENLTQKPRKWVIQKLTRIWAKIAKQGVSFIKEFLTESKKEIIKQSVKSLIDIVKENGPDLLN